MRTESKARRDDSSEESVAQGGSCVIRTALLVWLDGDRLPVERNFDQVRMPISLLNFEPFSQAMRPIGLRANKKLTSPDGSETKRLTKASQQESVANRPLAA